MDDPEAVQVLAAYFPPNDHVSREERFQRAVDARRALYPEEDFARSKQEVKTLIEAEEAEHGLLMTYWGVVILNMQALQRAIRHIEDNCLNVSSIDQRQELWFFITLALSSCAGISRMFEASHTKASKSSLERLLRDRRASLLKSAVGREGSSAPYLEKIRMARNGVEHFEEYLDIWIDRAMANGKIVWDLQCLTETEVQASDAYFVRWFDCEKKIIHVFDWIIPIADLHGICVNLGIITTSIILRGRYHLEFSFGLYD